MFEIYYTSAPAGLKSGSSGFCTVAATEGIAKPVLERLEALSGYRHHFAQGQGQANPVSWAHWLLSAGGKEHHVLSRVCDSGVDHTHRTNAFAHHIALESGELPPGGPAALLAEPGVMTTAWDGKVGALNRTALPMIGGRGPRACTAWQAAAGDAGYAGLLLEAAIRSPSKPVCILFSPGLQVLPLMEEVLALLPAAIRWVVTFNTYFTSMPTSASCAWRCCVARTPAADAAARAAAGGGIILNLADPTKLPALPNNAYVSAARAGTALSAGAAPTVAKAISKRPAAKVPPKPGKLPPPAAPEEEEMDLQAEIALAVQKYGTQLPAGNGAAPPAAEPVMPVEPAAIPELELASAVHASEGAAHRGVSAPIRNVEALLKQAEGHAVQAERRRKNQLLVMYGLAIVAVIGGVLLLFQVYKSAQQNEPPTLSPRKPATSQPAVVMPPTRVAPPPVHVAESQPAATRPVTVVETQPETRPVAVLVRQARTIVTKMGLMDPHSDAGISKTQTFSLSADDADDLKAATALALSLPGDVTEYKYETQGLAGVLSTSIVSSNRNPSIMLQWKESGTLGDPQKVVTLVYYRVGNHLDVVWNSSFVISRPEVASVAYWVLAQSTVLGVDGSGSREKAQKLQFKPVPPIEVALADEGVAFKLPADLPPGSHPVLAGEVAKGWSGTTYSDWEVKDPAKRSAENQLWVGKLKCATSSKAVDAFFTFTFKPKFASIETTWFKRMAADEADLKQSEGELQQADNEVKRITDAAMPEILKLEALLANYEARAKTPAAEGWTEQQAKEYVRGVKVAVENRRKSMDAELKRPLAKKTEKEALVKAFREAMEAYNGLEGVDVTFKLANELPAFTVRLKRK